MRNVIAAMLSVATLAMPAVSSAQDYGHRDDQVQQRDGDRRDGDRRNSDQRDAQYPQRDGDRRDGQDQQRNGDRRDTQYQPRDGDQRDGNRRDGRYQQRDGDHRDFRDGDRREDRFDAGRYYAPRGYAYRSWNVGSFIPRDYYNRRFWIANPFAYRLPAAYRGAQWVRYGPDALLIRLRDGAVLQVIPNRFY